MLEEEIDVDVTSQSHVYRALRRAESDYYGTYSRCLQANRKKHRDHIIESDKYHSKTALNTARIFCCDYSKLVTTVRNVTSKEIKSSVSRSRRWSGKDGIKKNDRVSTQTLDLNPTKESIAKHIHSLRQNTAKSHRTSAEDDYHKTVCDILTSKGNQSSYGHVARVISRKPNNTTFGTKLPAVNQRSDSFISQNAQKSTNIQSSRQHLDVTLPSVLRSAAREIRTRCNDNSPHSTDTFSHRHLEDELFSKPASQSYNSLPQNELNFAKICHVLSDREFDSLHEKIKEQNKLMMSLKKKQAQRAITRYYNQKQEIEEPNRVVIIHLPNPNISLESLQRCKRTPRLYLR